MTDLSKIDLKPRLKTVKGKPIKEKNKKAKPTFTPPKKVPSKTSFNPLEGKLFAVNNLTLTSSNIEMGYLAIESKRKTSHARLLILGGYENQRQGMAKDILNQKHTGNIYKIEPQMQVNIQDHQFFYRMQYDFAQNVEQNKWQQNINHEFVYAGPNEYFVLRSNYTARNIGDPKNEARNLAIAPFIKTPAIPNPIMDSLRVRFTPEYNIDLRTRASSMKKPACHNF